VGLAGLGVQLLRLSKEESAMKTVAIIVNIFFPGVGSFFVGKVGQAIAQLILYGLGLALTLTGIGAIAGIPICISVWIWGLITAATSSSQPLQVVVVHKNEPPTAGA